MDLGETPYGLQRDVASEDFASVVETVRSALAAQGFGVLTEIDIEATLRAKLGAEVGEYLILGACHPPSALAMLQAEPGIGMLLPCNVVVTRRSEGISVSAVDPLAMVRITGRPELEAGACAVREMLCAALDAL